MSLLSLLLSFNLKPTKRMQPRGRVSLQMVPFDNFHALHSVPYVPFKHSSSIFSFPTAFTFRVHCRVIFVLVTLCHRYDSFFGIEQILFLAKRGRRPSVARLLIVSVPVRPRGSQARVNRAESFYICIYIYLYICLYISIF